MKVMRLENALSEERVARMLGKIKARVGYVLSNEDIL